MYVEGLKFLKTLLDGKKKLTINVEESEGLVTRGIIIIVKKRNRSYDALIPSDIKEAISTFLTDKLIEESIRFKEFSNNGNR